MNDQEEDDESENFWGERPPLDFLLENFGRFFQDHDLDHPIIELHPPTPFNGSPMVPAQAILGSSGSTSPHSSFAPGHRGSIVHKKSIRIVAQEAKDRFSRQYSGSKVMRRKSTKMWGSRLAEVMDQSRQGIYQHPQSGTIKTFQYLKGGLIGRGSFGKVYHAFNLDTCEMIAIKQVDLPQTLSERNCDRLKTSVEALFSEMEVLKDLDHENIVQYLGFAQNEETANIFLEYVSGGSIESCLKRSGPFPEAVIRSFTRQILLGLEYIHSKKIVHRDIKAANVLVDEQGICKISDFGISKKNAQSQGGYDENVGSLQGSVFWMAPEMVTSKAYGAKVDIWSFGCLVLEMFTGQQPWKGYAPQQALFTIGSSSAHPPIPETISEDGQRFLSRCFITDANSRPTAAELLQDLFAVPPANFNFNDYIEGKITD
ncbi:MAG: kinase-like domain-containing protein [Linnemannia gamsii]|nr:MAG: kinase-like domain-containing protein [Linnemannia gamsii]